MKLHTVYAFTKDGTGGNPAGVVLLQAPITEQKMQSIAKKAGYSETAFVQNLHPNVQRIRFFTPTSELTRLYIPIECEDLSLLVTSTLKSRPLLGKRELVRWTSLKVVVKLVEPGRA